MAGQKKRKKMKPSNSRTLDFEFDFPEEIIQHIQSFMDGKQAAGTCMLSKSWYQAWSTRPILAFDVGIQRSNLKNDAAIKESIISGMKKHKESNLNLQKLGFRFGFVGRYYTKLYSGLVDSYASLVDELINNASELGVNELHLDCPYNLYVPDRVFAMTSLNKLSIQGCMIKKWPIHNVLRLVSLRMSSVSVGYIEYNRMIQDILLQCPSIEDLDLENVNRELSLNLGELHNLVYLRVRTNDARSNVSFETITSDGLVNGVPEFHKLRVVCFKYVQVGGDFFANFSSRFPCIEDLSLEYCHGYEKDIQISSKSLRYLNLVLVQHGTVKKAELDVPNIRKFGFGSSHIPALSFSTVSKEWESKVELSCTSHRIVKSSWFVKLRHFLKELSLARISLNITNLSRWFIWAKDLPRSSTPVVENLKVGDSTCEPVTLDLLCALLRCCRPTLIIIGGQDLESLDNYRIINLVYELFNINQNLANHSKCFNTMQTLLMYDLEGIDLLMLKGKKWQSTPLTKFVKDVDPDFNLDGKEIRFQFKWGAFRRKPPANT